MKIMKIKSINRRLGGDVWCVETNTCFKLNDMGTMMIKIESINLRLGVDVSLWWQPVETNISLKTSTS